MIHFAAQGGSIEMLNLLKNKKSDTLAKNSRNETALHIAVLFRNYKFVEEFKKVALINPILCFRVYRVQYKPQLRKTCQNEANFE